MCSRVWWSRPANSLSINQTKKLYRNSGKVKTTILRFKIFIKPISEDSIEQRHTYMVVSKIDGARLVFMCHHPPVYNQ